PSACAGLPSLTILTTSQAPIVARINITTTPNRTHRADHFCSLAISYLLVQRYRSPHLVHPSSRSFLSNTRHNAEALAANSLGMLLTHLGRHAGWKKGFADHQPAKRRGELAISDVDVAKHDGRRNRERPTRNNSLRRPHELDPYRQRAACARESKLVPIVESDPHQRHEPGCVADEPRVTIRTSCFPRRRNGEAQYLRHSRGPAVHDGLQEMRDEICLFGRDTDLRLRMADHRGHVRLTTDCS